MTIEEALKAFVETNVPSAGPGYPLQVPGDAGLPAWSYQTVDDDQLLAHDRPTGFHKARIQLDLMATEAGGLSDYANAKAIAAAAIAALDGYQGSMSGIDVDYCHAIPSDDWADIHQLPVQRLDVRINYR
jgi:hypothetical protein